MLRLRRPSKVGENPGCFKLHFGPGTGLRICRCPGAMHLSFVTDASLRNEGQGKQCLSPHLCLLNNQGEKKISFPKLPFFKKCGVLPGGGW